MTFQPCDSCKSSMLLGAKMCPECRHRWREWMNREEDTTPTHLEYELFTPAEENP